MSGRYQRRANVSLIIILLLALLAILLLLRQSRQVVALPPTPASQPTSAPSTPPDPFAEAEATLRTSVDAGRWQQAASQGAMLLARREVQQGASHPDLAGTLVLLAEAQIGKGAHEDAERSLLRALDLRIQHRGEEHASLAEVWLGMARSFYAREMLEDAENACREGLAIARKQLGKDALTTYHLHGQMALTLVQQEKWTPATPHLLAAANWIDRNGTPEEKQAAYQRMVTFYGQRGDRANEALWRGKLKSVPATP